jgi:hypothetical protein
MKLASNGNINVYDPKTDILWQYMVVIQTVFGPYLIILSDVEIRFVPFSERKGYMAKIRSKNS